ncbi:uncharacterized protein LTR77_000316 [Saxophila tyrrhenica]|uniref:DUF7514 domain-containing protein n=1 Tax=Saxophila tyrrhenica TaxID=1690608 RepID=A0AAV9PQ59_9PEZI|nr:hypothetical protein LTR77_000316 [Saxophila tyrrhenica]
MAGEGMRVPSPPLPPDPSSGQPLREQISQPPLVGQQTHQHIPTSTTPLPPSQPDPLKRADSLRSPPPTADTPISQQRQPIKDAINHAASNVFEHSPEANQMSPEFINQLTAQVTAQVTEQVLRNLQSAAGTTPKPSTYANQTPYPPPPPPPPPTRQPRSPTQDSTDFESARYTPPTPDRSQHERAYASSSPEPPLSDVGSSFSRGSRESTSSYRAAPTPKPVERRSSKSSRRNSYLNRRQSDYDDEREAPRRQDSMSEETAQDKARRGSYESQRSYDGAPGSRARPVRLPSDIEETPLEKFWQPLFENGNPTMRLGQFLRGLAMHIIEDYEPKGSIVITPAKMLQFLSETKIEDEQYPWDAIFGGKLLPLSISKMFQKLLCQHHYVQERIDSTPSIPALTPLGFETFMTCLIQAHPDIEYERFAKAVRDMPISNADNKTERFPKELSRRLFPPTTNIQAQQRLISSLTHEPRLLSTLNVASAMPPPPSSAPPNQSSFNERERMPYSSSSQQSNAFDDDDLSGPQPVQIERERKPYTAREGAGKVYGSEDARPPPSFKPEGSTGNRTGRTNSGVPPHAMFNNGGTSDPMNIPSRPHRMSTPGVPPPNSNGNSNGGYAKSNRRSSPPMRNPYTRSEPGFADPQNPSSFRPSRDQHHPDIDDDAAKRYRSRSRVDRTSQSNPADDEPRGYPIPGRSVPINNGYEYGAPPLGTSVPGGSYPSRRPPVGTNGTDDRRRSMYNPPTTGYGVGDGGTDGYGSFAGMGMGVGMNPNTGYPPPPPPQQGQVYGSAAQH